MKYIFYCIYNTQYLDGKNRVNKSPWLDALGMMMGGTFCWASILVEVLYFYVLNENTPGSSATQIAITCGLLFWSHYFWFIKDKKYEGIYDQYNIKNIDNRKKEKWIAIIYIFLPAILSMLIAMKWHKVI